MLLRLRAKQPIPPPAAPEPGTAALERMCKDAGLPLMLRHVNTLPDETKKRLYRPLLPAELLAQHDIDPITWLRRDKTPAVLFRAPSDAGEVHLSVKKRADDPDAFIVVEMHDNGMGSVDLNLLLLNNPEGEYFRTDFQDSGESTQFGTVGRNLPEEIRAKQAGLAPAQTRESLGGSKLVLAQVEQLLMAMGQRAYFVEPLTYVSAWVFEKRGFNYVRGHKLMEDIHEAFQPGGTLDAALDGSTPFRLSGQGHTVRGRAWAIHDGILERLGERWNDLRMIKQIGRMGRAQTFPDAEY